ncbi:META domain-containing protein [Streptomyces purpureus]|uniref:Lipoprotein n=1 Tax=Streptomyces purpureus TaxID=1951 RepID=A0A918HD03_9ACTN|nr:META domain-containing protein [Streptomyces purpureus]GGT54534.1 lipoprotein [Streptomyces purpureus]
MPRPTGMQKPHSTALAAVALLGLLTACGTQTGSGSGTVTTPLPVTGTDWTVDSVTVDGRKTAAPSGAHVEIAAKGAKDGTKGEAKGSSGCNQFRADVAIGGDSLTVTPGETTEIGCPEDLQAFEAALGKAFTGTLKAKLTDGKLTLTGKEGTTIALSARPPQPPAPLEGTSWKVDSLTSGDTVSSVPAGTEGKAHFTLGTDGSIRGNLGCNSFTATTKKDATTLTVGRLATTRMLCQGPRGELESAVGQVLQGKITYKVEGRTLTLTAANGKGLTATAAPAAK